ncbi:MAG: hypothetical protein H7336_12645, partial [Bacteriovorax sp.]|nr:hypothetical protein [Bacteriovorax sp.]
MSEDFTTKSSFCVAPWIHYHRSPIGEHRLCCISEALPSDISDLPYEEIKNSKVMKNVRKQMMSGELPEQCKLCKHSNSHEVYKDILNGEFSHTLDDIVEKTDEDGATTMEPLFLDYRFLACGLTCLTCNPFFSSKWVALAKQTGHHHIEKNDTIDFLNSEFKRVLSKYRWERVSFAGGEPLMQKDHLED